MAVLLQVLNAMPIRASTLAKLHDDVDRVLAIAMAKKADARFEDGEEFADALAAALRGRLSTDYRQRASRLLRAAPPESRA